MSRRWSAISRWTRSAWPLLYDDFDHRDERTGPVTAMQPMEQASRQRGPSGRRAHEASMRYFERLAASVPDLQFKESGDPRQPRFWQVTLDSPAGYRAAGMLAARLGLSTSPVLLAAFAVALASVSVSRRVAVHLVCSNRFRPGFADSVSPVMQSCLGVIDTDGPFEEVVRRAWQSALGAYKHAYYDPAAASEVCERLVAERGAEPDWSVVFNDRRVLSRESADTISAADGAPSLRDELTRSTLTWGDRNDMPLPKVFLSICDVPGTLSCELWADTHFMTPADMEGLLRRIETVLVDAALADDAPVGIAGPKPVIDAATSADSCPVPDITRVKRPGLPPACAGRPTAVTGGDERAQQVVQFFVGQCRQCGPAPVLGDTSGVKACEYHRRVP